MPSPYSSSHSISDGEALVNNLGINSHTLAIGDVMKAYDLLLEPLFKNTEFDINSSNIELNNYTIPYYNKLRKILPRTKFTVADYGEKYFEPILNDEWFAKRGTTVLRYFHDYEILDNKDNFCNLFAETTPNLDFRNNNWYAIYTDGVYRPYSNLTNIELFFSSSDLPKLDVKQTYMLKNFCKIKCSC